MFKRVMVICSQTCTEMSRDQNEFSSTVGWVVAGNYMSGPSTPVPGAGRGHILSAYPKSVFHVPGRGQLSHATWPNRVFYRIHEG